MAIFISLIINFFSLWLMVALFDSRVDSKMKRIIILTLMLTLISITGRMLGIIGILIGGFINLAAIMKILGYDFIIAFLFLAGLELLQYAVIYGLLSKM